MYRGRKASRNQSAGIRSADKYEFYPLTMAYRWRSPSKSRCRRQEHFADLQKAAPDGRNISRTFKKPLPAAGTFRGPSKSRCRRQERFADLQKAAADGGKTESTVKSAPIKKERRAYVTLRSFLLISNYHLLSDSNIFFNTVWAEISRFAASGMTMLCGLSITSSVTIIFRRTGRQCMK